MNEKIVKRKDVMICTENVGHISNPAVLLMMGATASMLWWDEEFCERLAQQGFFVIRYDNRDVGKSTTYTQGAPPYGLEDIVDDAIHILDAYNIHQAHLVGMSLGGLLAQMAALIYPERVKSLVLIATGPFGPTDPNIPAMDERIISFQAKAAEIDWTDESAVAAFLLEGAEMQSGTKHRYDKQRGEKLARAEFKRANNYISMFNHAALQGGENHYGKVDQINQSTLIIHGTEDPIWNYQHAHTLLDELKQARLVTLEGAGHELHYKDWELIIESISQHIAENS